MGPQETEAATKEQKTKEEQVMLRQNFLLFLARGNAREGSNTPASRLCPCIMW